MNFSQASFPLLLTISTPLVVFATTVFTLGRRPLHVLEKYNTFKRFLLAEI